MKIVMEKILKKCDKIEGKGVKGKFYNTTRRWKRSFKSHKKCICNERLIYRVDDESNNLNQLIKAHRVVKVLTFYDQIAYKKKFIFFINFSYFILASFNFRLF